MSSTISLTSLASSDEVFFDEPVAILEFVTAGDPIRRAVMARLAALALDGEPIHVGRFVHAAFLADHLDQHYEEAKRLLVDALADFLDFVWSTACIPLPGWDSFSADALLSSWLATLELCREFVGEDAPNCSTNCESPRWSEEPTPMACALVTAATTMHIAEAIGIGPIDAADAFAALWERGPSTLIPSPRPRPKAPARVLTPALGTQRRKGSAVGY